MFAPGSFALELFLQGLLLLLQTLHLGFLRMKKTCRKPIFPTLPLRTASLGIPRCLVFELLASRPSSLTTRPLFCRLAPPPSAACVPRATFLSPTFSLPSLPSSTVHEAPALLLISPCSGLGPAAAVPSPCSAHPSSSKVPSASSALRLSPVGGSEFTIFRLVTSSPRL